MGGDCLNTGCVPSKALIRSAKFLSHVRRAKEFGIRAASADFDFAEVMERVQSVVKAGRAARLGRALHGAGRRRGRGHGADHAARGRWRSRRTDGTKQVLTTRNIVIAAGARPFVPPIPGLAEARPLTSDNVWELRKLPGAPGGAGRRAHRLRARAGLRALRREGDAGGDAAAPHDPRGPGGLRAGDAQLRGGRRRRARGPQGEAGRRRGRREVPRGGGRGRGEAHRLRRDPRGGGARGQHRGLRARGAGHRGDEGPHGRGERVPRDGATPTSSPAATSPAPTSSRTPRRTWRGTRR